MAKVKICGLQSEEDIEIVNVLLPDYAGFIFCPSKRQLDVDKASSLCASLDDRIKRVGVFVNQNRRFIERAREECSLDVLQMHGDEAPDQCMHEGCEVWKAIRVRNSASILLAEAYTTDRILFDAYDKDAYGGSGKEFNWELLSLYKEKERMILAGGLSPENIEAAVSEVRPYAVDVSSGVETEGRKDFEKVKLFIERARRASVYE